MSTSSSDLVRRKNRMLQLHLVRRNVADAKVLEAFRRVPREEFVPEGLVEFAYDDAPLPIGESQTISQPYIVAMTLEALDLRGGERVLEIGTGSGYAAALLGQIASEVHTVERIPSLATAATERLARLGYSNVHVHCGDGTLGWAAHAPYDAIAVAAGGPKVPKALLAQLAIGGRLVIPVGDDAASQELLRVIRTSETTYSEESLGDVRFVPLIGEQGWEDAEKAAADSAEDNEDHEDEDKDEAETKNPSESASRLIPPTAWSSSSSSSTAFSSATVGALAALTREVAQPIESIDDESSSRAVDAIVERVADARLVLLGESTHGTSEFYRMRARITKELIERRGFQFVAVEADWPDATRIDDYVLGAGRPRSQFVFDPFSRFPRWMWRNEEVRDFVYWLRARNERYPIREKVGFHGLDLYSMFTSIGVVLAYLDKVDPDAAFVARHRYGRLTPWQRDPAAYGEAVLVGRYQSAEDDVVSILRAMLERRLDYARADGSLFFDAAMNARVVANAERYYRAMYYGRATSWNLRDAHMFDTLGALQAFYGGREPTTAKGIVWAHNSHVGNALATEMSARGEHNVGQLCRAKFGDGVYIVGFATDHGTVAAASNWDESMGEMTVRPSHARSYERIFHESGVPAFTLPLREPRKRALRDELEGQSRLERAIGVVYRPDTELASHYFYANLPRQFDELIWFDETHAIHALDDDDDGKAHDKRRGGSVDEGGVVASWL